MTIRKAGENDYENLKKLKLLAKQDELGYSSTLKPLDEAEPYYLEYLKEDLAHPQRAVFFAIEDDETVGMVLAKVYDCIPISKYQSKGYISNLYVLEQFRKRGIGAELAQHALAWLRDQDVRHVLLEIHEGNHAALALYRKLGFQTYTVKMTKDLIF